MSLANKITLARAALIPPVVLCLVLHQREVAAALFLLSCAGDVLDGIVARSRGEVTAWGKALDPTVDKALFAAVLATLAALHEVSILALILFFVPQVALAVGALVLRLRSHAVQGARFLGKAAAAVVVAGAFFLVIRVWIGPYVLYSGIALTYVAGLDYLRAAMAATRSSCRERAETPRGSGPQSEPSPHSPGD
jgi:CDP-diacylglycerol--glycerol-3-phosphate 3-phosphatidyltransferase